MNPDDVPQAMQPQWVLDLLQHRAYPSHLDSRLTFHNFTNDDGFTRQVAPHNSAMKQSDHDDWPPRFLFDVAYGFAALKTWGVKEFVEFSDEQAKDIYYCDGDYDGDGDNDDSNDDDDTGVSIRRNKTIRPREGNRPSRTRKPRTKQAKAGGSQTVDYLDIVVGWWMRSARQDVHRARMMKEEQTQKNVQEWLQSVS
jgi:hypothetical protein